MSSSDVISRFAKGFEIEKPKKPNSMQVALSTLRPKVDTKIELLKGDLVSRG